MKRRTFLKSVLGSIAALFSGAVSWIGCALGPKFELAPDERETLKAASARILPSDDGPGAIEAGAPEFIERALRGNYYRTLREPFRTGLALLNRLAQESWRKPFAALEPVDQDSVLSHLESGRADTPEFPARRFFSRLVTLTLEGYLGDPVHGGNRNEAGWKYLGFKPGDPRPGACQKDCEH